MESSTAVVTGSHNGWSYPWLVADHVNQHAWLVDVLLGEDGPHETLFYVWHKPVVMLDSHKEWPKAWMRIGYHNGYGAAFFHDDSTPPDEDWAWIAVSPDPVDDPPTIFYDTPTPVIFPPAAVMTLASLREVILQWCRTGERPTNVDWLTVNSQDWDLDEAGTVLPEPSRPRRTRHYLTGRGKLVVREYGWGTDRTAPEPAEPQPELTYADHRTGRTAFGTAGPDDDHRSASRGV
jgi:hypothetical protein